MSKRKPIRRGALGRGLAISLAGARAGGAFALDSAVRRLRGEDAGNEELLRREAERFARSLGELKGTYVKIGQIFALLGEHFLPEPLTTALHKLESETQPLDWQYMEPVLQEALGEAFDELDVEREALAAASLAQVHRATIRATGEQVVVKCQYPELAAVLDDDFDVVVRMLRLSRWIPASRDFDAWLGTMREQLHAEIDYPRELAMARRLQTAFAKDVDVCALATEVQLPRYHDRFCSGTVLTMDYLDGYRVTSPNVARLSQKARNDLGRAMLQLFFVEIFELGLMQSDPNFGNYLIGEGGERLSLLDFGSVLELNSTLREALIDTIVAGHEGDDVLLLDALIRLGCLRPDSSDYARDTFRSFIRNLLEPLRHPDQLPPDFLNRKGEYCWAKSGLINRTGKAVAGSVTSRHFTIPTGDFALIARKLTGVFTFIAVLEAEFNSWELIAPVLARQTARHTTRPTTR